MFTFYTQSDAPRYTEKVFHQCAIDQTSLHIPESNDGGSHFPQTKMFHHCREGVSGIVCFGVDLTVQLPVGQHVCVEDWAGPVGLCLVEDGLVEYMVIAEVSI